MQIKIPTEVKIGTRIIPVIYDELGGVFGLYDPIQLVIVIDPAMNENPQQAVETFVHELQHAIHDYASFELTLSREVDDAEDPEETFNFEEAVTERVAKIWQQVLMENDLVVAGDAPVPAVEDIELVE